MMPASFDPPPGSAAEQADQTMWLWERMVAAAAREREASRRRLLIQVQEKLPAYFQVKRVAAVYLVGSLLRAGHFYPFSDIDLAVAELQEDYFTLLAELEDLLDWRVDIIELERCRFREKVMAAALRIR